MMRHIRLLVVCLGACSAALSAHEAVVADDIRVTYAMFEDPEFEPPEEKLRLSEKLLPLWRQALSRPETDYQRLAAEAIAEAAESGFPDLEPAREDLVAVLISETTHPAARFAAARALIALDARSAAPHLFEMSRQADTPARLMIEPVLARWDFEPVRPVWRKRLQDDATSRRELLLALEGLAGVRNGESLSAILQIVHAGDRPADVRLSAARAAGAIAEQGLEADAAKLLGNEPAGVVNRLCAVALLSQHDSARAIEQLTQLARDAEPAVAEPALGSLFAIDPSLVLPLAEEAMQRPDPKVRRRGADAFVAVPNAERVAALSLLLDDVHPDVRRSVRDDLFQLADQPELDATVRRTAVQILNGESWRGQEQAALLLAALDHEPAAGRLLELLHAERFEVLVTAAWALRVLAVPDTAPELLVHARHQTDERQAHRAYNGLDEQVAHLLEALALLDYAPAEPLLREYVPKDFINGYYSRGAGIWGLGIMKAGQPDEGLARQLVQRMNDRVGIEPDLEIVWQMSATSLGRMQAASQLPALRERLQDTPAMAPDAYAIRWAILQITGEKLPDPGPMIRARSGWFLEPLSGSEAGKKEEVSYSEDAISGRYAGRVKGMIAQRDRT